MVGTRRAMTAADLFRAVQELTGSGRPAVATGDDIRDWLVRTPHIDPGEHVTPVNKHWWAADHANAPSTLRKFKVQTRGWLPESGKAPCSTRGDNGWCLVERWDDACAWTTERVPRWRATPWCRTCNNWIFECSALVQRGSALVGFDDRVLSSCAFGPNSHQDHPRPRRP